MTLAVDTVLVPVDGSDESAEAARYAVAIADRYDATVHVLYMIGERVGRAIQAGDLAGDDVAEENRAFVADVRDLATGVGVTVQTSTAYAFSTTRKMQHPGSVILDVAEEMAADFLVIPREATGDGSDVLEKAAEYVLLYASQPVLSV